MFTKFSLAEFLALISALSVTVAISRLFGYFLLIDIKLMSLISMTDVVSASFYTLPITAIPVAIIYAVFDMRHWGKETSLYDNLTSRIDELGQEEFDRALWKLNRSMIVLCVIVLTIFLAIYWQSQAIMYVGMAVIGPIYLYIGWFLTYSGHSRLKVFYRYGAFLIMMSFLMGIQEGQFATTISKPNYRFEIEGVSSSAFVSRFTQNHMFLNDASGSFRVVSLNEVTGMTIINPAADWFN